MGCALAVACTRRALSETSPPPHTGERQPEPLPRHQPITSLAFPTADPDPGSPPAASGIAAPRFAHDHFPPFLTLPHPAAPQATKDGQKASQALFVGDFVGRDHGDDLGARAAEAGGEGGGVAGGARARQPGLLGGLG